MSCNTESWCNGTLNDAVEMLAKRAAVARLLRKREKSAAIDYIQTGLDAINKNKAIQQGMTQLQRQIELNPAVATTLLSAAAGAGLGGISSLGASKERRNVGRSMLTGALGGGAAGLGGYMASRFVPEIKQQISPKPGPPVFNIGDSKRTIDPEAVKNNPLALAEANKLKERSWLTKGVAGSYDFAKNYVTNHPILSTLLAGDVASHAVGTAANAVRPTPGNRTGVFRKGMGKVFAENAEAGKVWEGADKHLAEYFREAGNSDVASILRKARAAGPKGTVTIDGRNISVAELKRFYDAGLLPGGIEAGGLDSVADLASSVTGGKVRGKDILKRLGIDKAINYAYTKARSVGDAADRTGLGKAINQRAGMNVGAEASKGVYKGLKSLTKLRAPQPGSLAGLVGSRAALYLGVPAVQEYLRTASRESGNNQKLQQLIDQLSTPVKE